MIPKTIHYCWFGKGKKPVKARKCIASWYKLCPDYKIVEWNESNFDINMSEYTKFCYENKKYAYLSDYVRLWAVYNYGGIYLDTDVEIIKALDELLEDEAYFGFENDSYVASGLGFGAKKGNKVLAAMIAEYDLSARKATGCPRLNTDALLKLGLELNGQEQVICGARIYPQDYFNPYDELTGRLKKTKNTYSIHWFTGSAMDKKVVMLNNLVKPIRRIFGSKFTAKIKALLKR